MSRTNMMTKGRARAIVQVITGRRNRPIARNKITFERCCYFLQTSSTSSSSTFPFVGIISSDRTVVNFPLKDGHWALKWKDAGPIFPKHTRATTTVTTSMDNSVEVLRGKTSEWLQSPINSWTRHHVSKGRFLMQAWSENHYSDVERATQQTRILRRWMKEHTMMPKSNHYDTDGNQANLSRNRRSKENSKELVEMLNRCLDSWRKASMAFKSSPSRASSIMGKSTKSDLVHVPVLESMELINSFRESSEVLNDPDLKPTQKTYSMCLNILALYPESKDACQRVLFLTESCRRTATPDLQFYNVCLHTLAKCAIYHDEAPGLVEQIFSELTTGDPPLRPNTACFVSLLHAWANRIPMSTNGAEATPDGGPAERTEAILDQMIQQYPELIQTICFNICIDAWAKQGNPERAEAILWRLHNYSEKGASTSKTSVHPNEVSFNSTINAWAKTFPNKRSGWQNRLERAAERAERLLELMKRYGYKPTVETYGMVMEAFSNIPNSGPKVESILENLEKLHLEGRISFPPSKVCHLMAIRAWGNSKSEAGALRAEAIVQRMEDSRQFPGASTREAPCVIIYTALLSAWAKSGSANAPDRCWAILQDMHQRAKDNGREGLSPNTISFNMVLEAFCAHDRIEDARAIVWNQMKSRMLPDERSYYILLKAYGQSKDPNSAEKAESLLWDLENDFFEGKTRTRPNRRMYSQILVAWGNSSRNDAAVRAESLFWKMLSGNSDACHVMSVAPDTSIVNGVLRAWSKSFEGGAADRAEAFLEKVQSGSNEIPMDLTSYLHLIYAWAHSRRKIAPKKAEGYLQKARELCLSEKQSDRKLTRSHWKGVILAWEKSKEKDAMKHITRLQNEMNLVFKTAE